MRRIGNIALLIMLPLWLEVWSFEVWGSFPTMGKPAPNFLVESGDAQKLSLDMVRGKLIVLFYESRHSFKENSSLKEELTRFYRAQPAHIQRDVFRLVVIDCSTSTWATAPIWKSSLRRHSGEEGFTIYGDWNRKMFTDYRMKAEESNFLIIDKQGIIRYVATGKVNPEQFKKIKELLLTLVQTG
jgi:alkyl hydroperoxide reductase subunit AhpC